ncbi:hypothetical protein GF337_13420 [candidate division KSB1 bacterium]|nr:hypothetical protein [candidate division KSB1 bacterium]
MSRTKVAIAAGHYPQRPGATATLEGGFIYVEHELATQVTARLKSILSGREDIEVQEVWGTLQQKVETINRWAADLALEVHFNDAPNPAAVGTETLYYAGSTQGKKFAIRIQEQLVENLGTENRGAKIGWYQGQVGVPLYFLKNTLMPAIIIEVCFLNGADIDKVIGIPELPEWENEVADAIAAGISEYLSAREGEQPAEADDMISDAFRGETTDPTVIPESVRISENDILPQLSRFKDFRYRNLDSYSVQYPIPVKVDDRIIQGNNAYRRLDCSTFVESFIIGGIQRLFGDRFTITQEQHAQLMILSNENKPDGPIRMLTDLGLGESYSTKENGHFKKIKKADLKDKLAWSIFQGWREDASGHIFIVYKSRKFGNTYRHLILECNRFYNLDGVGVRFFGNFDSNRFAAILSGEVPEQCWVDHDYLLSNYPELYGIKLNSFI